MKPFYVSLYGGRQSIVLAKSETRAIKYAISLHGRLNVDHVKPASQDQVDWHLAFGGIVYKAD